ncbi:hypothetical protein JCM16303_001041 [Sporobolomyces ruberrimus]
MLVLDARTDVPLAFGSNTIFATSQLDLCLAVSADSVSVQSVALATSAVIREIVDWLRKRLKNDLNPFRLISNSISKILDPATLISTGQLDIDELSLVNKTKQDLISLLSPTTSSTSEEESEKIPLSSLEAIEKAFLLVAKQPNFVDPLEFSCSSSLKPVKDQSSKAGTSRDRGRGRVRGRGRGRGTGRGRVKRIDTVDETSLRRGGRKRKSTFSDGLYQTEGDDLGLFEGFEAVGNGFEEGNEKMKAWTGDGFGAELIEDEQEEDGTAARLDDENGMDRDDKGGDEWLLCEGPDEGGDEGVLEF